MSGWRWPACPERCASRGPLGCSDLWPKHQEETGIKTGNTVINKILPRVAMVTDSTTTYYLFLAGRNKRIA